MGLGILTTNNDGSTLCAGSENDKKVHAFENNHGVSTMFPGETPNPAVGGGPFEVSVTPVNVIQGQEEKLQ